MAAQLSDESYKKIKALCQNGDKLSEQGKYDLALKEYVSALAYVPAPVSDYEASTWILTAIGDTFFQMKNYNKSLMVFLDVMPCPDAIGNPFIHLRLGQSQFENGNMDKAKDELVRAYMGGGAEIFAEDDEKYFGLVKDSINIS
jgi:tetratricopeptide (TPR) repeat protein